MQSKKVIITSYIFLSHEDLIVYTTYYMRNYIVEMYKQKISVHIQDTIEILMYWYEESERACVLLLFKQLYVYFYK